MKTYEFSLLYNITDNYTPSSCMIKFARKNNYCYGTTPYGNTYIKIDGTCYVYSSGSIRKNNDGTEIVTVYLIENKL